MHDLAIPISIWLNAGILIAAAGAVWFKLRSGRSGHVDSAQEDLVSRHKFSGSTNVQAG